MCERSDLQFFQDILESINAAMEFVADYDNVRHKNDLDTHCL